MVSPRVWHSLYAASYFSAVLAAVGGSFEDGGNTLISAMMMFLGNEESVYILDKAENNAAQVLGHPAWGSLWDIKTRKAEVMDVRSNVFCASGMHLPNGSFVTFGGNDGVGRGGKAGSQQNADGTGAWDSFYQDFDGRKAIRLVKPCKITDQLNAGECAWFDDASVLSMKKNRWYSAAEPTGDGEIVIIGGFIKGGYINREFPIRDPFTQNAQSEPTYEYFPPKDVEPPVFDFIMKQSGLNAYAHTYLMPSGKMLVQANLSTILWDHVNNIETPLPPMPNGVVRVYPASGAAAMLPLTPDNNWTPTLLFCGGSTIDDQGWGNYSGPFVETYNIAASKDCQRLTPEPPNNVPVAYEQDDDMLDGRTMGQFIALPDGTMLVINGGAKGTAGYSEGLPFTPFEQMPFGTSLAAEPVLTPAIYDPRKPKGSRWSSQGLNATSIPRLYHSTAILLPDASVLIAGSNPNVDVDIRETTLYKTEYRAEIFYPPYFSAKKRPTPQNVPSTLSYGGEPFQIQIPASSYSGLANAAADTTTVTLVRGGFTTHGMNMGQRILQLDSRYTVNKDGSITLHVSQLPPNPNLFQPGPALLFVNVKGIPSVGKYVIVGSGLIEKQPTQAAVALPQSAGLDGVSGTADSEGFKLTTPIIIGIAAGGGALLIAAAIIAVVCMRRRKASSKAGVNIRMVRPSQPMGATGAWATSGQADSEVFSSSNKKGDYSWDSSTTNLHTPQYSSPYRDAASPYGKEGGYNNYDSSHDVHRIQYNGMHR